MKCARMSAGPRGRNPMINCGVWMEKMLSGLAQRLSRGRNSVTFRSAGSGDGFREVFSVAGHVALGGLVPLEVVSVAGHMAVGGLVPLEDSRAVLGHWRI